MRNREASKQLSAEIKACIEDNDELTGYQVVQRIQAPPRTIRDHLARMVEAGELDCTETSKAKVYSVPVAAPEPRTQGKPMPPKLYSRGRSKRGKSMIEMAFEGN